MRSAVPQGLHGRACHPAPALRFAAMFKAELEAERIAALPPPEDLHTHSAVLARVRAACCLRCGCFMAALWL